MIGIVAALAFLVITLFGYFNLIKMSKLEKDIRKNNLPYTCFECKEEFSINETKCPKCSFETIYGKRKSKFFVIVPILVVWLFLVAKFLRRGVIS